MIRLISSFNSHTFTVFLTSISLLLLVCKCFNVIASENTDLGHRLWSSEKACSDISLAPFFWFINNGITHQRGVNVPSGSWHQAVRISSAISQKPADWCWFSDSDIIPKHKK